MMTFEFFVLLFDPWNEKISVGLPIYKMVFDTLMALGLGPLHHLEEKKLTGMFAEKSFAGTSVADHPFDERKRGADNNTLSLRV